VLNVILLTIGISAFALLHIRRDRMHLLDSTHESADLVLSTIKSAVFNSMCRGDKAKLAIILETIARSPRLITIRLFNPEGKVVSSSVQEEIGKQVDPRDLELFTRKEKEHVFNEGGQRILSIVRPINPDQSCARCHGEVSAPLGLLSLHFDLADTTKELQRSSRFFMVSTALIILCLSGGVAFTLIRFVRRPIRLMADTMAKVESGDLSVRLTPLYADEIGRLMSTFNSMVVNMDKAQKDLEIFHFRQMERADRLASIGQMATGIAHEIKNPLAGISGVISVLRDDFTEDDPRRKIIGEVLEQIGRLDKTATDLLRFGRPGTPERAMVDINALVKNTLFFISQNNDAQKVYKTKELSRDLPSVWVDEKQIQQVLFNIMINAVQSMKGGGSMHVSTCVMEYRGGSFVQININDTGVGITQEDIDSIFTPFYTTKTQGTGLGLAICKRLIEQHGGRIIVESTLGEGATFTVELPLRADRSGEVDNGSA